MRLQLERRSPRPVPPFHAERQLVRSDAWLQLAADRLREMGFDRVFLERTPMFVTGRQKVLGYYSWGSNDQSMTSRTLSFSFVPGLYRL